MIRSYRYPLLSFVVLALLGCSQPDAATERYDLVINGGRVMDPASGLDAVRHVGIRDGRIAVLSENTLMGTRVIDATGLVVAPGFIDLHAHGAVRGGVQPDGSGWRHHGV